MSNSYTSIKINTANAAVNSKVGIKIPTTLGFLNKGETYTIQFKYIHLKMCIRDRIMVPLIKLKII